MPEIDPEDMRSDHAATTNLADFMRTELLRKENARARRAFYSRFIKSIVIQDDDVEIRYDPARLVLGGDAVHSDANWLPELDSNQ
jgi:hypothetical protein